MSGPVAAAPGGLSGDATCVAVGFAAESATIAVEELKAAHERVCGLLGDQHMVSVSLLCAWAASQLAARAVSDFTARPAG